MTRRRKELWVAESKASTIWAALGVIVVAIGVMIAWLEYRHKLDPQPEARPTLDIISAVVSQRSNPSDVELGLESDELRLTIKNIGSVEATNITIQTPAADALSESKDKTLQSLAQALSQIPDIPVGGQRSITIQDVGERGDKIRRASFQLRLRYLDRNNSKPYDETSCFYTSTFEVAKDIPTDPNLNPPVPLIFCGRTSQ
jgi:hypothetical protein